MQNKIMLGLGLVLALWLLPRAGHTVLSNPEKIEVSVQNVLIPKHGFDDNDHVQAVIYGELPHACFTLGETSVERINAGTLTVRQFAWLKTTGVCASGDVADSPVPYTVEVSLGRLDARDYEIRYHGDQGPLLRAFSVGHAETELIDNYHYAQVTDVSAPPMAFDGEKVSVTISGLVDTSCARIGERMKIEKEGDVIVVLPIESRRIGAECQRTMQRFRKNLSLGALAPGQYLVHVRSQNGKALNRVFDVVR